MNNFAALTGLLLVGCASVGPIKCDVETVPNNAASTRIHGGDFVQYPSPLPASYTGCQYTWTGDRDHPKAMEKLQTAYFKNGKVQWFEEARPNGAEFRCVYKAGVLDVSETMNAAECPLAADLERR